MRSLTCPLGRNVRLLVGDPLEVVQEGVGDLGEDLLLGVEVRVERAVGDPCPPGDVADVGVEVAAASRTATVPL